MHFINETASLIQWFIRIISSKWSEYRIFIVNVLFMFLLFVTVVLLMIIFLNLIYNYYYLVFLGH